MTDLSKIRVKLTHLCGSENSDPKPFNLIIEGDYLPEVGDRLEIVEWVLK